MKRLACLMVLFSAAVASAQDPWRYITREQWSQFEGDFSTPVQPFKILDNLYYVGARNIGVYLLVSSEGHLLLDSGMPMMAPRVIASIKQLGFNPRDVKIVLSSHAHVDHVGGHAEVQRATGARIMAMVGDAEAIERGVDLSPVQFLGWMPAKVDRVLKDGDTVTLGRWTLRAVHIPGHTPGATTWVTTVEDGGRTYVVMFGGAAEPNAGPPVWANLRHPTLADDTLGTYRKIREMKPPDVQLTGHPQTLFAGKLDAIAAGVRPHPLLVDPIAWAERLAVQEKAFRARVDTDKAKAAAGR